MFEELMKAKITNALKKLNKKLKKLIVNLNEYKVDNTFFFLCLFFLF